MCFSLQEALEHKKQASRCTFLLINLDNFINIKDAYDNFSHTNFISDQFLTNFMLKIMFTADVVKIADITVQHDHTNVKSAILTTSAVNMVLFIKFVKN